MTTLTICDDYSSESAVGLIEAPTRRALSRAVQEANPGYIGTGSDHDCTGRVCGRYAQLLRAYRVGSYWVGVVVFTVSRDV
jgi:hypothetical protein